MSAKKKKHNARKMKYGPEFCCLENIKCRNAVR